MAAANLITRYARAMIFAAETQGHDIGAVCRKAGIPPEAVDAGRTEIGPEIFGRLNRVVKLLLNDEFCGFTPNRCKAGTFMFVCESMIRDDTLGSALTRAFRFYDLVTDDLHFALEEDQEFATISLSLAHPEFDRFHYLHEWWLLIWPHFSSWLIGEEIPVNSVDLPHEPGNALDEYPQAFWGPCRFSREQGRLQFPARFLQRRIVRGPHELAELFTSNSIDLVSTPGVHRSWRTLIKAKMKEYLFKTENLLSIEDLAREFNMSSQTLRRRLDDDGISFRALKDEVRREVILKWLSEPDIPIGEVSLRAGFAERNGLVRAVRSWVGVSPKEYRCLMTERRFRAPIPGDIERTAAH
jgi:AraC-like DNA-binding protein